MTPPATNRAVTAVAPGRVNLVGDHTDHTGGLVLPLAVDRRTRVEGVRGGRRVVLQSEAAAEPADLDLDVPEPAAVQPRWARYVAGVVAELQPATGLRGRVVTTLPLGAGLSSSAALEVALALALGFEGSAVDLARACQSAEHRAVGVPCGIMDQLTAAAGVEGHALLIDCSTLAVTPVPLGDGVAVVVVDSGQRRELAGSGYADRRERCQAAEAEIGPLRGATEADVATIVDPATRRRARHVVTENARVVAAADALGAGDHAVVGQLMAASHASLRDDFEVSTARLDQLVDHLAGQPGVFGARLTGAGFGGSVVALAVADVDEQAWAVPAQRVRATGGAAVTRSTGP